MGGTSHNFLANHALCQEACKGLVDPDDVFVPENLREKS